MNLEQSQARRRAERERRRKAGRRRLYALAALIVVVAAIVVLGTSTGGTHKHKPSPTAADAGTTQKHRARTSSAPAKAPAHRRGSTVTGSPTGQPGTAHVPILMYHVIAPPPAGAPFPGLYVPAPEFAEQMKALKQAGWVAVTMDQMLAYWKNGTPLPKGKPIVLSFDNGYHSQYASALPILKKLGWVGVENIQLTGLPPSQGGMTRAEVQALIDNGWELDTQGISHADMVDQDAAGLKAQIDSSRATLRRRFHVPVNWFCYPSGQYDSTVIAEVKAAGYVGSTTVVPGWANSTEDPYALPRLRVLGGTSGASLLAQIDSSESAAAPGGSYETSS